MRKLIFLLLFILIISCANSNNIVWMKKTELNCQYVILKNNQLIIWSIGKGYTVIDKNGNEKGKNIFKNGDRLQRVSNIKVMNSNLNTYGIIYSDKEQMDIVEILNNGEINEITKVKDDYLGDGKDYLVSEDKKRYMMFNGLYESVNPLDQETVKTPDKWLDVKTQETKEIINPSISEGYHKIYYNKNKYFSVDWKYLWIKGIGTINFKEKVLGKDAKIYFGEEKFPREDWDDTQEYSFFTFGEDGYYYSLYIEGIDDKNNSKSYYIVKLTDNFEVIGKRLIKTPDFIGRSPVANIAVDKDGYIYIISDIEKSLTKFKPIKEKEEIQ